MKKVKTIISLLLIMFLMVPFVNANADTRLNKVKKSLRYSSDDNLQGHTEEDLLTKNYDFYKNAKFTTNDKLMYRFTLAYAVRNAASREKGTLYTNEWFEKHYKEILDKAYAGADTEVNFYKNKKNQLCIKVYIKNIYLNWGFRDAIRTEIIKDMAEVGIEIPRNRISVTSSKKENARRKNPCPGLSNTLLEWCGASDKIRIAYYLDTTSDKNSPGTNDTEVDFYVDSKFQEAVQEYANAYEMPEFKAVMRLFNSIEFDNLIRINVIFKDYTISNIGTYLENEGLKSAYGLTMWKDSGSHGDINNDSQVILNHNKNKITNHGDGTAYNWLFNLTHQ